MANFMQNLVKSRNQLTSEETKKPISEFNMKFMIALFVHKCCSWLHQYWNYVIYDVIIWVRDGNCKKWKERMFVLVRSTM